MESCRLGKYTGSGFSAEVPASKSILARALLLAAFSEGDTLLAAKKFGEDPRTMISCLTALGIGIEEREDGILVHGSRAVTNEMTLDVGSAGTVARFLTAMLAYRGGTYSFTASAQMERRPMQLLAALEGAGVSIEYEGQAGHFPFRMRSNGLAAMGSLNIEAATSTQYASGLMLAAAVGETPFRIQLSAFGRVSYLDVTENVIRAFGGGCTRRGGEISVTPIRNKPVRYEVEPDVSAACYFFAAALLLRTRVRVAGMPKRSIQGDIRFFDLLAERGVTFTETPDGLLADGTKVAAFEGFVGDVSAFSDQALTLAALAPFAATPTHMTGIRHIRGQECDRVQAIRSALTALGVPCTASDDEITIMPAPVKEAVIETYGDHRVAMAFALVGLKTGLVTVTDPDCCKKTFDDYFRILTRIAGRAE